MQAGVFVNHQESQCGSKIPWNKLLPTSDGVWSHHINFFEMILWIHHVLESSLRNKQTKKTKTQTNQPNENTLKGRRKQNDQTGRFAHDGSSLYSLSLCENSLKTPLHIPKYLEWDGGEGNWGTEKINDPCRCWVRELTANPRQPVNTQVISSGLFCFWCFPSQLDPGEPSSWFTILRPWGTKLRIYCFFAHSQNFSQNGTSIFL